MLIEDGLKRIQSYEPVPFPSTAKLSEAAVLMPLTRVAQPELILTLRAQTLSTHSGEVAFPGGRRDPEDTSLVATALREAYEEVGLEPECVEVVGQLSSLVSRHGIKVTPYVGLVPEHVGYRPNAGEIASIFSVPLEFFANDPRHTTHRIDYLGRSWYVPSYTYADYKIWGLTAVMVVELVNVFFDLNIEMTQPPQLSRKEL